MSKQRVRDYGSGSMKERSPGVWLLRVSAGQDPVTGETRRISRTFRGTGKEARAALATLVVEASRETEPTAMTVADVVRIYLSTSFLAKGTKTNYVYYWSLVPSHFAAQKAQRITCDDVSSLYRHLFDQGLTANGVRQLDILLKAAFNQQRTKLPVNPCVGAKKPVVPKTEIVVPPKEAVQRLVDLAGERTETAVWLRLLLVTGSRRGESLALRWSDVDFEGKVLRLRDQIDADGNVVETTKAKKGRPVYLDDDTLALLADWRDEQREVALGSGVEMAEDAWVLSRDKAGAIPKRGDSMYQRFKRLAVQAGIPYARPHSMRHYMISHAMDGGENLKVISKIVGHSSPTVTLKVYTQMITGADQEAMQRIGANTPMPVRTGRRRSPFDDRMLLAGAIATCGSRNAILKSLGLAPTKRNYDKLAQRAEAFGLTLPAKVV